MDNKVVNSGLSEQGFINIKLQDELLLSSGDSSCKFLRSRPLALLSSTVKLSLSPMLMPHLSYLMFLGSSAFKRLLHHGS